MAVSKRLRYEILRRDNHTCRYCGATAPDVPLRVDHVVPVALGGSDTPENLVTACEPCNSGKSATIACSDVIANVKDDTLRWSRAMRQTAASPAPTAADRGPAAANALIVDACTTWAAAVAGEPTHEEWLDFLLEVRQAMKEGYDRDEILHAAKTCGRSRHRTFLTCELPLHPGDGAPGVCDGIKNDEEFEVLADIGPVWLEAMQTGPAPYLVVSRLQASIVRAHREGHSVERIKEAARMGGLHHDPEISVYLGWLASRDAQSAEQREGGRA